MVLVLSENHTLVPPRDLAGLVAMAAEAERAGFDGVMVSEHIVLGLGADADGLPENPRDYALPGNQDPATPWPSSLLLLAAVASVTTRLRLIASAVIPPLRHPLQIAKARHQPERTLGVAGDGTRIAEALQRSSLHGRATPIACYAITFPLLWRRLGRFRIAIPHDLSG